MSGRVMSGEGGLKPKWEDAIPASAPCPLRNQPPVEQVARYRGPHPMLLPSAGGHVGVILVRQLFAPQPAQLGRDGGIIIDNRHFPIPLQLIACSLARISRCPAVIR